MGSENPDLHLGSEPAGRRVFVLMWDCVCEMSAAKIAAGNYPQAVPNPSGSMSSSDAAALDDAGRLVDSIPCVSCEYNLRGLSPTGSCPECGHAVALSVKSWEKRDSLTPAERWWIEQNLRGVSMLLLWPVAMLLILLVASVVGGAVHGGVDRHWVWALISLLIFGYSIAVVWLATTPGPSGRRTWGQIIAAWLARLSVVLGLGIGFVLGSPSKLIDSIQWANTLVLMAATMAHFHGLAEFLGERWLARIFFGGIALALGVWISQIVLFRAPDSPALLLVVPVMWIGMARLAFLIRLRLARAG